MIGRSTFLESFETGLSFETVALFPGSSLINLGILETVSKAFVTKVFFYLFEIVLEIFLQLLRASFFSVKIILLLVLYLLVKKGLIFRNYMLEKKLK